MTVQGPPIDQAGMSDNDRSLVLSMAFAGQQLLFPGDIEAAAEDRLVTLSDGTLESVVLKVPHHGSRTWSSTRLLDAVRPRLAVVSAGRDNRFGFPHPEVLRRYAGRACTIARTDIAGAIQVRISARGRISWQSHGADATESPLTL